ncbi:MAG: tetraacyldisaccharide 4'-kinase [Isosphaeraceae bacterium]|jgi:tetraacyldisaccharide 4'-kinase|nr:MAG: tetraacyldisaccharide 4'-kinase [Isosphaeraceae bacterium]
MLAGRVVDPQSRSGSASVDWTDQTVPVFRWDLATYEAIVRGTADGPVAAFARAGLSLASVPYRLGVAARNLAYDRRWLPTRRAEVPVISVGNLTFGGTGKTPLVEWIARRLRERGLRVVLLSRGYRGDGGLNDEGRLLDQNLPDVPHLQDRDRVALARIAVAELEAEALVLDDGFQHRRLARDLDIVLLDALDPFGGGRLAPRGRLRESARSLRRAGVVVLSRADLVDSSSRQAIRAEAERRAGCALTWAEARHAPRDLIDADDSSLPLDGLSGRSILAFCGIGNPEGFRRTLETLGVQPRGWRTFPDHHRYTRSDVLSLIDELEASAVDLALTTQKDLVKLRTPRLGRVPLLALRVGLEFLSGEERVRKAVEMACAGGSRTEAP